MQTRLSEAVQARLRCPSCGSPLRATPGGALCAGTACGISYPIIDGVPVLIDERRQHFLEDFALRRDTTFRLQSSKTEGLLHGVLDLLPDISNTIGAARNYARFRDLLLARTPAPRVLVLGGSIPGNGMEVLASAPALELVATDVSFGPLTALICDAHDIPFADESFDGLIVQVVLEHVRRSWQMRGGDPQGAEAERSRVCRDAVHAAGAHGSLRLYAFHAFRSSPAVSTFPGDRERICLWAGNGPAWSYQYFLLSFTSSRALRGLLRAFVRLTAFYLSISTTIWSEMETDFRSVFHRREKRRDLQRSRAGGLHKGAITS